MTSNFFLNTDFADVFAVPHQKFKVDGSVCVVQGVFCKFDPHRTVFLNPDVVCAFYLPDDMF